MGLEWYSKSKEKIKEYEKFYNKNRIQNLLIIKLSVMLLC